MALLTVRAVSAERGHGAAQYDVHCDGAVTAQVPLLGQVAELVAVLRFACTQLHTEGLIEKYGPEFPMAAHRQLVAPDCLRIQATETRDPCGVHFPQLVGLFR